MTNLDILKAVTLNQPCNILALVYSNCHIAKLVVAAQVCDATGDDKNW